MLEGNFFPKIGKWLTPIIKDKKLTYSNSSFKLWKERKYAISLIIVKKYKALIFLVVKTVKDATNHLLKLAKLFSQWLMHQFTVLFYKNNFIRTKALILVRKLRTNQEQRQACCPTEQKSKVSRLAILKIIRTQNIRTEPSCLL